LALTIVSHETLQLKREGGIAEITLNRPDRLNAMNDRMFAEIAGLVRDLAADDSLRVVIYTGAGRAFCAGREIAEIANRAHLPEPQRVPPATGREFEFVEGLQVPVIAAINGAAAGSGFGLALLADFRIASETAIFLEAHVQRGLTPSVAAWYLPRLVGLSKATEMLLFDERVTAAAALDWGLVNRVVAPDALAAEAWALARRIEALPPLTTRLAKRVLHAALSESLDDTRKLAGWGQVLTRSLTDEQRAPNERFRGKPAE